MSDKDDTKAPKEPRKKSDAEKKEEKDAMVNLWMNNLEQDNDGKAQDGD